MSIEDATKMDEATKAVVKKRLEEAKRLIFHDLYELYYDGKIPCEPSINVAMYFLKKSV